MGTTQSEETHAISDDEVRGGVTGHNVRYVLAYGLTGIIAAFACVAIYFGYDRLQQTISEALSRNPADVIRAFAPYAAITFVAAVVAGLLLGLWSVIAGRSDGSQYGMRLRVVAQFAIICAIMSMFYFSTA